jgi:ribokinase
VKAVVVGSANTDLIIHVDALPSAGATEVGHGFKSGPGGKGANQAVCLSKLGTNTHFIARFGKDEFGATLLETISRYGVHLTHAVIDEKHRGGVVFILVDRTGNSTMIADLGSNLFLDGADVSNASEIFRGADLLLLQFEVSDSANKKACELAAKNGARVVLNPAPMRAFDPSILPHVDVLTPNLFELSQILRFVEGKEAIDRSESDVKKIEEAAGALTHHGVRHVLVTLGSRGCIQASGSAVRRFGTYRVKQIDSTGAGDAFTAAFALKFAAGVDVGETVRYASACAALSVTREGAIPSMPDPDEVEDFMSKSRFTKFE